MSRFAAQTSTFLRLNRYFRFRGFAPLGRFAAHSPQDICEKWKGFIADYVTFLLHNAFLFRYFLTVIEFGKLC